jgi:hypothetical protein
MIGGHWMIFQSVAWVLMTVQNLPENSLSDALVKTFDGNNPCQMCKTIEKGKESEKKNALQNISFKQELFHEPAVLVLVPPAYYWIQLVPVCNVGLLMEPPLSPPPKVA